MPWRCMRRRRCRQPPRPSPATSPDRRAAWPCGSGSPVRPATRGRAAGSSCSATSRRTSSSGSPRSASPDSSASSWRETPPSAACARPAAAASHCPRTGRRGSCCWPARAGRRRPGRPRRAGGDASRPAACCSAHRQLVLRGSAESLELRVVAAAPPDDDRAGLAIATRLAEYLGRTVALSRPFHEPGARPAAEAAARATLEAAALLSEPPSVARAARLPAYLLARATCATCPTGRARPASCWRRSSSGGRSCRRSAWPRSGPCSGPPRSARPRPDWASIATRSPTGSARLEQLDRLGPGRPGPALRARTGG